MDKNALDYCRELSLEVADLDQRIDQLRSKVESRKWPDGLPHSNYAADRLSGIVAKIADLDAVRRPKAAELAQLRKMDGVNSLSESIVQGYVSAADLRNVLRREYNVYV